MLLVQKLEPLEKNPLSLPLFPPQIPHELAWDQIQAAAVRRQQLAA
jgi:hypothetical protein